ncbi:MAG: PHP domain-containing protein [Clostridiaceae bacterium]
MYKKGDFHVHTRHSDGRYSPKEVIDLAKKSNLDVISITDHDTLKGVHEAIKIGKESQIKVVPGIELSTTHEGESIHVLGYFKDTSMITSEFKKHLKNIQIQRYTRAEEMVHRLDKMFAIKISIDKIMKDTSGIIARPHLARAIIEAGYNFEWSYIFEHIIGKGSPAYVPSVKLSTEEGLELLSSTGALKVLAHPVLIKKSNVELLLKMGFDGIESRYYSNTIEDTEKYLKMAKEHKKIVTAGSDFHGIAKTDQMHSGEPGTVFLGEEEIHSFMKELKKKGISD